MGVVGLIQSFCIMLERVMVFIESLSSLASGGLDQIICLARGECVSREAIQEGIPNTFTEFFDVPIQRS